MILKRIAAVIVALTWLLLLGCSSEKGSQLTAYEVYSELYGEYVCQDEDGGLSMRVYPKGKPHTRYDLKNRSLIMRETTFLWSLMA